MQDSHDMLAKCEIAELSKGYLTARYLDMAKHHHISRTSHSRSTGLRRLTSHKLSLAMQKDATAWERWVYLFAHFRQLAVLAPHLPTADPQLRVNAYEMVLHSFLLVPADHSHLLKLVQSWPSHLYSLPTLTQAVIQRYDPVLSQSGRISHGVRSDRKNNSAQPFLSYCYL